MYICNITGKIFDLQESEKHREGGSRFGYNIRFRAICYILTKLFYGECKILHYLKENKQLKGIGMSDTGWAQICSKKFNYVNTFYHTSPYLDIYNEEHVNMYKNLDFIISSDVFEHINPRPSVQIAFNNLYTMLKPGGYIIFSVPFTYDEHIEHFPNLHKYEIKKENSEYVLHNTTIDNTVETFHNLCFHGGPGNTLEMRVFSHKSILSFLEKSGFVDIIFHDIDEDMNKYGIFWENKHSLIITAKKPLA